MSDKLNLQIEQDKKLNMRLLKISEFKARVLTLKRNDYKLPGEERLKDIKKSTLLNRNRNKSLGMLESEEEKVITFIKNKKRLSKKFLPPLKYQERNLKEPNLKTIRINNNNNNNNKDNNNNSNIKDINTENNIKENNNKVNNKDNNKAIENEKNKENNIEIDKNKLKIESSINNHYIAIINNNKISSNKINNDIKSSISNNSNINTNVYNSIQISSDIKKVNNIPYKKLVPKTPVFSASLNLMKSQQMKEVPKIRKTFYNRLLNINSNNNIKNYNSEKCEEKIKNNSIEKSSNIYRNNLLSPRKNIKPTLNHKGSLPPIIPKKSYRLQYYVLPGNNGKLIDDIMKYRENDWEKVISSFMKYCDFLWTPLSYEIDYNNVQERNQLVNHFEFNSNLSNKMKLYGNFMKHCESKGLDTFKFFPFTVVFSLQHNSCLSQLAGFRHIHQNMKKFTPKSSIKFADYFNVFLSRKIGTEQTINIPETFNDGNNLWIIKPVNLNRGRCIKVEGDIKKICETVHVSQANKKISGESEGHAFKCEYLIIQKYLERPLLYQGRKFDIRLWVMLDASNLNFVYIFKQGHLKASSIKYDVKSSDLYVHLTNYSVQKHNKEFSKVEIGNEIPFKDFQEELDKNNTGINFMKDIYPKICYIIRLSAGSVKYKINYLNMQNCFEIFGYDFIIDDQFNPYLLEINTNPGLEISSPLIEKLVPRMIDDALKLTIDKKFPRSFKYSTMPSNYKVDGFNDSENLWEKFQIL